MSGNSENQINLKTLQRVDSNIIEIIDNTSQVAIYKYDRKLEEWEGTDVEGTLFLYKRCCSPFHGFIIVNRMNTTNFVESITSDMQFQLQEPYLLYKNTSDDIIGCWFYEHKDLKRISKKIKMIVLKQSSAPRRQRCASESETTRGDDIISLLSQAHENYMKNASQPKIETNNSPVKNPPQESSFVSPRRRFLSADGPPPADDPRRREKGFSRLFPIFGQDEDSAKNGLHFTKGRKLLFDNLEPPGKPDWKTDQDAHFTSMKQVLKSSVEENPKLILQIHEAYISSLRSLLNKI